MVRDLAVCGGGGWSVSCEVQGVGGGGRWREGER